ncbi:N-acetyl-beta-D-glucosaminidase [Clostridia bacterium]|nr:N-acetyl-beta-D-glucosaminidase [Clostridia bacterium]
MLLNHDIIRRRVFGLVGCEWDGTAAVEEGPGLSVEWDGLAARITAENASALARGYFLLARAVMSGQSSLSIRQERHMAVCGAYLDMSRGGVMNLTALRHYVDQSAALGLNALMLYTEDTYTIPEYPYFGYLRGRYTPDELRELDNYADGMGVELIPSIQALAHLGQFLQWAPSDNLKDTYSCLMIDDPKTYEFLDSAIRACRACFRSKRIHIGMDEAHGVGLDRYFERHGLVDRFELLRRHLDKVVASCKAADFEPIMWSDMFFRLGSKTNEYYDLEAHIPESVIDNLPDVTLCYWDYYHTDEEFYDKMLDEHFRMSKKVAFAGGVWTWSGFLPHVELTRATMLPALRSCAKHGVPIVLATLWGDDGTETDYNLATNQLAMFSEFCWQGPDISNEEIDSVGAFLTGLPAEVYEAFGAFYEGSRDLRTGKALVYCDVLYPLVSEKSDLNERMAAYANARQTLAAHLDRADCRYADAAFHLAGEKARVIQASRAAYKADNKAGIQHIAEIDIPCLVKLTSVLRDLHREQWESTFKRNGWEVMALRYGAVIGRLEDAAYALARWASGELDTIVELDEEPLPPKRKMGMQFYNVYVSPQYAL